MKELTPPASAVDSEDGDEICRVWIADGDSHVALNYGIFGDDELRVWGMVLADVVAHVVRAGMMRSDAIATEAFAMLEAGFRERLQHNPTVTGSFAKDSFH